MPISAPGNRNGSGRSTSASRSPAPRRFPARGFTLIELMVVVAIVALTAGLVSLSIRDPAQDRLQREGQRLAALLESARSEARAAGLRVRWLPGAGADLTGPGGGGREGSFRFVGLPRSMPYPERWLSEGVSAEVMGARALVLGPEPLIGAQQVTLRLEDRQLTLATDGLGPFQVMEADAAKAGP